MYSGTGENTTLIKTWGTQTLDYGIDISSPTYRTASIKAPNFTVNQVGTIGAVAAALSNSTAAALTFSNSAGGLSFRNGGTSLTSPATATLQFGLADSGTPVAQILKVQNGSGTNIAGQNFTIIGSLSTGTGTDGDIIVQTGVKNGTSGTVAATPTTALTIKAETLKVVMATNMNFHVYTVTTLPSAVSGDVALVQ